MLNTEDLNKYINALLNKSEEAYLMSIEIINKPTINYRTEGFCFFICNAWELLLKAYLFSIPMVGNADHICVHGEMGSDTWCCFTVFIY